MAGKVIDATLRFVDKFTKPMEKAVGKIQDNSRKINRAGKNIEKTGKNIQKAGENLTKKVSAPIAGLAIASIKAGSDFESAFAGVKKTIDGTDKYFAGLRQQILDLSKVLPASASEIAAVAEQAGQLGIDNDKIIEFTKVMINLGESTNLSADEASSALAQYANITKMPQTKFEELGSTIVDLGNNFATTESDIVNMATRLAGAGSQVGLTDAEIMGFSTALTSVGIQAEMGGSAFSKAMISMQVACETGLDGVNELTKKTGMSMRILQLMSENNSKEFKELAQSLGYTQSEMKAMLKAGQNLKDFANIAGMTSEEFKKLFEQDSAKAIQAFISGLGDVEGKGESTIKMLQDMGFTEVRLRDTLTRLASSGELVTKALDTGRSAWEENTALTNEAKQRYETFESQVKIMRNRITDLGITIYTTLNPYLLQGIDIVNSITEKFAGLSKEQQNNIMKFAGMVALIGPTLIGMGKMVQATGRLVKGLNGLAKAYTNTKKCINLVRKALSKEGREMIKNTVLKVKYKALTIADSIANKALAATTWLVTTAQTALNAAFIATPIGWIVLGIGAIILVGVLLCKNWDTVKAKAGDLWSGIKSIFGGMGKWFDGIWDGVKTGFKGFINFIIRGLNKIPEGLNKLNVKLPSWLPEVGGKELGFSVPTIPYLANGTNNWKGGLAQINEPWIGGEIVDLPSGTRVYPHDKSVQMAKADGAKTAGGSKSIVVQKLADSIVVREEADIDKIVDKLVKKLERVRNNTDNEVFA